VIYPQRMGSATSQLCIFSAERLLLGSRWENDARVGAFCTAWWHEDHQPPTVAALNRFELADKQPMMRGRDKAEIAVANVID
jgi:hypothetical protein